MERRPDHSERPTPQVARDDIAPLGPVGSLRAPELRPAALVRVLDRKPAEVEIRKRPTQARGAATFDAILDAAARLLEEAGYEVLTTNLVAEVAGVNIATLYQYFPSKESILLALFRRDTDARMALGMVPLEQAPQTGDWRAVVGASIDILAAQRRLQPGTTALRRAMRSLPELQAYERETMLKSALAISGALTGGFEMEPERAQLMGLCAMEMITAMLDLWSLGYAGAIDVQDDRIIEELKAMVTAYLAPQLDRT